MSDLNQKYFDIQFENVNKRLDKIDTSVTDLYSRADENIKAIIKIETRLESGNKKFEYFEKEISMIKESCSQAGHGDLRSKVNILWKVVTVIGSGFLIALTTLLVKVFQSGGKDLP